MRKACDVAVPQFGSNLADSDAGIEKSEDGVLLHELLS
jgi:hypothetical protein